MTRDLMQEIMGKWDPEEPFVIIDHQGQQGLDAAAYYLGHGLKNVRCLRGGIDAWSLEVDETVPRYEFS
jgi:rhodanese-related sulfurtransferase